MKYREKLSLFSEVGGGHWKSATGGQIDVSNDRGVARVSNAA